MESPAARVLEIVHRTEWARIVATLIRLVGDFDLAEETAQEAFTLALERWPVEGVPEQPRAWLVSTARHKAIDRIRRRERERAHASEAAVAGEASVEPDIAIDALADDRLRLLFTCCHPALAPESQVALTLRTIGGLTSEEIARAFLLPVTTLQQRVVRAKATLLEQRVPYEVPEARELPQRLPSVLTTLYLAFNEGHSASRGASLLRVDLCEEAISLARALAAALPDEAGAIGLLALLLLIHARRGARLDEAGELVTLDEQERRLWDTPMADEGRELVRRALGMSPLTRYALQAAIAAVHADARDAASTDWRQIAALYAVHMRLAPSPVVELNAAVAHAIAHDVDEGLARLDVIEGELEQYAPFYAARADLLRRVGRHTDALTAYRRAAALAGTEPERRYLGRRARELEARAPGDDED